MAAREKRDGFVLEVPLDASGIEDFKPDQPVKVLLEVGDRTLASEPVQLDTKGAAVARFNLPERPRGFRVIVGPGDASDDELLGLQTLTVNVPARHVAEESRLRLAPIKIPPFYWHWWYRWCRTFTVHGVVRCADGSPVPGATVCAYDVDWWWWWSSKQLLTCTTTDASGAFSLTFKWCCGWWPWWWWKLRHWQLEPALLERITPVIAEREDLIELLGDPTPQPALASFEAVLARDGTLTRAPSAKVDPASLPVLREQLVKKLPESAALEQLRVWPWWPWTPWWDCTPDLIFKVTQECEGDLRVIVDESIFDARTNIPNNSSVTLVATDEACCLPPTHPCGDGNCTALAEVCEDPSENIGGNPGAPAVPAALFGYLNPGAIFAPGTMTPFNGGDSPYAENVRIYGTVDCMDGVDYYEFEWTTTPSDPTSWAAMPIAASGAFHRHELEFPSNDFYPLFAPQPIDGHNVYETIQHYEATHNPADWATMHRVWVGSTRDLLTVWQTAGNFADDVYFLRVRGWNVDAANHLVDDRILKICESTDDAFVAIRTDNRVLGSGPTDLHGLPCGSGTVHACTNEPDTAIADVQILHADGSSTPVQACGSEKVQAGDKLQIDFIADDPAGHLAYYTVSLTYGVNQSTNLLALPGGTLTPAPGAALGVAPAAQVGPGYGQARLDGAAAPFWRGGALRLTVDATGPNGAFPYTCCYQIELRAHKRTIVNCDHSQWAHTNFSEYSFTINV